MCSNVQFHLRFLYLALCIIFNGYVRASSECKLKNVTNEKYTHTQIYIQRNCRIERWEDIVLSIRMKLVQLKFAYTDNKFIS